MYANENIPIGRKGRHLMRPGGRAHWPTYARFLQADPMGYEDGMNLYGYVGADPINFTDPSGLSREVCWIQDTSYGNFNTGYVVQSRRVCVDVPDGGGGGGGSEPGRGGGGGGATPSAPPEPEIVVTARRIAKKVIKCAIDQYGFGDDDGGVDAAFGLTRGVSEFFGAPVPKELFGFYRHPGSSPVTNVLNALSVKTRIGARVFFEGNTARLANKVFKSARVATVLGRANVFTGGAFALYDIASIAYCASKTSRN